MHTIWIIAKRELYSFFYSPIAYIVYVLFFFLAGLFFMGILSKFAEYISMTPNAELEHSSLFRYYWNDMLVVLLFLLPALTMPLLSEEKRSGTLELLLTKPITDWEVVLGKYLGVFLQFLIMVAGTLLYVLVLFFVGEPDLMWIATTYLGVLFVGASFLAVGLFASSVTDNQIISVIIGIVLLLVFWLVQFFASMVGLGIIEDFASYLSLASHFESFGKGLLDAKDIFFYLSFIVITIFMTVRVVESHKWR